MKNKAKQYLKKMRKILKRRYKTFLFFFAIFSVLGCFFVNQTIKKEYSSYAEIKLNDDDMTLYKYNNFVNSLATTSFINDYIEQVNDNNVVGRPITANSFFVGLSLPKKEESDELNDLVPISLTLTDSYNSRILLEHFINFIMEECIDKYQNIEISKDASDAIYSNGSTIRTSYILVFVISFLTGTAFAINEEKKDPRINEIEHINSDGIEIIEIKMQSNKELTND